MPSGMYPLGTQRINVWCKRGDLAIKMPTTVTSAFNFDGALDDDRHLHLTIFAGICTTGTDKKSSTTGSLREGWRVIPVASHSWL